MGCALSWSLIGITGNGTARNSLWHCCCGCGTRARCCRVETDNVMMQPVLRHLGGGGTSAFTLSQSSLTNDIVFLLLALFFAFRIT